MVMGIIFKIWKSPIRGIIECFPEEIPVILGQLDCDVSISFGQKIRLGVTKWLFPNLLKT